jgi:hypothetical protein
VFLAGSAEPGQEVGQVQGPAIVWERQADGLWHSTAPEIERAYTWRQLCQYPLTEVVSGG